MSELFLLSLVTVVCALTTISFYQYLKHKEENNRI